MKTKISHLGRSTVSVILAVMMLLSTMLIGTVSTVNAVTKTFKNVNLVGDINGNVDWSSTEYPFTFDETTGYWFLDITITQLSQFKARVNDDWAISFGDDKKNNYVISDNEIGDYTISIKDGSDDKAPLTVVKKTVKKVADSVTLTASSSPVQVGTEVTLTASLNKKATGLNDADVAYAFEQTDGAKVTGIPTGNTYKFTPATAGDYTFEVTASAENYTSVTNTVTVTATSDSSAETTQPVTSDYYFWYSTTQNINLYSDNWKAVPMTKKGSNYSVSNLPVNTGGNFYFIVNKDAKIPYRNTVWKTENEVTVDCSTCAGKFSTYNKTNYHVPMESDSHQLEPVFYYYISVKKDGSYSFTFDGKQTVKVTEGSILPPDPTDTVTITVPTVENAKVTAVANNSTTYNEGASFNINEGSSFTVNVEGEHGYTLNKITYGKQSGTETGAKFTAESGVKEFSVVMNPPVSDPVTVTFKSNKSEYGTVSAKYNGVEFHSDGTVTVKVGDEVTFTAAPSKGYIFTGWTVNGAPASSTTNPYTIKVNDNTTVVANFKVEDSGTIVNDMYFLYGSSTNNPKDWEGQLGKQKYDVYEKGGKYIVTLNTEHYKQLFFAFSKSNYYKDMTPKDKLADVKPDNPVGLSLVTTSKENFNADDTTYLFGKMSIVSENSDNIGDIKIIYDPTANTYTVKATKDSVSDTTVNIVGKDGTVRGGYYDKTTSALGNTELEVTSPDNTTITVTDSCIFDGHSQGVTAKKVTYGSKVTVKTTINPNANFAGHKGSEYYVKGFSINGFTGGVLTQEAGNSHEGDVYEYTFTVKKDVYADVSTIEITPIYFLRDDSNCVTFYVENFMDAKAKWGDTIACYAYYSDGDNSGNALGGYPGQPMVNAEGSIYMQIPKYIGDGDDQSNVVKGITLNNYVWDFVHVSGDDGVRESKNCQTYDYDDFKYLANMSKVNSSDSDSNIKNIVYRFKYHTYNNTSDDASAAIGNVPKDTLPETTVDANKYEVFVDYYDKPTDIFGTVINSSDTVTVETVKAQEKYLTIVSDGYVNYYDNTTTYLGQYATKWYIYDEEGQKVAALPPSALLYGLTKSSSQLEDLVNREEVPQDFMSDSGASTSVISGYWDSFKSLYTAYEGKYAIINYESSIRSGGRDGAQYQPGERCDGRWYYSVDKAKITGDIKIEYADTLDSFTTMKGVMTDTFDVGTATGTNTAAEAYFTSPVDQSDARLTHVETTSDNSENFMFTVGATSSTTKGYTFVGWYRLIDDTYKAVNDPSELNKTTGQVARNANVVLVARYIKTPGGSMTFNHSLYKGENAGGGKATTEIQVVVKNSEDVALYDSGRIAGTASIDKTKITELANKTGLTVTVTLYTTTKNLYNFNCYYSAKNTTNITIFAPNTGFKQYDVTGDRKTGLETKSEYTFSFDKYYAEYANILIGDDAGTVYYNFYSDITSIKVPYKVQFSYEDREGNQKYYNKAGYVDPENTSSYKIDETGNDVKVTLENSFILNLAPYESNFAKDLTWDENSISNTAFDSSKSKSIASAVVNSTQSPRTIHLSVFCDKNTHKPTSRDNKDGVFEFYEKDGSFELPYGSVFYEQKPDGTYKYDITAEKTYEGKQFMYWAIYSDSRCRKEDLVINAYNSEGNFSYVAYDNCWIVPVYGESSTPVASVKDVSTSTQFMEVTRNQWTANNADSFTGFDADNMKTLDSAQDFIKVKGEDKLYADFVLNFFYNGKQLSVFDPESEKVETGVLIQRLELEGNKNGPGYITDLNHYANKYSEAELEQAKNDAINKINNPNDPSTIKSVKQPIANSKLDNKNRLHYYTIFNNVKGNNNCVFRLYTYIQYTNASGEKAVQLSNPVYFTFYDIANKS